MGATKLLLAIVTVNLISNSLQISTTDDIGRNAEQSETINYSDLPQKYRDALIRIGGTNFQHLSNSKGSGKKTVKITIRRKVKSSQNSKNEKAATQTTIYRPADENTPHGETNYERVSFSSNENPKYMAYKNYMTSVNSEKRVHKILPYEDVARARFKSMYYGNKRPEGENKNGKYNLRYMYNKINKTPETSYADVVVVPDNENSDTNSIDYNKPQNVRGSSKTWQKVPSIKHSVKVTKHVIRTKTRIPMHKLKEAGFGDFYNIDYSSEQPIEGYNHDDIDSNPPPNFETNASQISPDMIDTSVEDGNLKYIPSDNVDYKIIDENSNRPDTSAKDPISEQNIPELPPSTTIAPPEDQVVILNEDLPIKENTLKDKPNDITVNNQNSASESPKYVIIDVLKENANDKPLNITSKEFSSEFLVPTEIPAETPKVINVTPPNTQDKDSSIDNFNPPNKKPGSEDNLSDVGKLEADNKAKEGTIYKIKPEDPNKDIDEIINVDPNDAGKSDGVKRKKPFKMIAYKKTSERNVHKHKINVINYMHNKLKDKTKRPGSSSPFDIILDSQENPSFPGASGKKDNSEKPGNGNNKDRDLIPDVIKVTPDTSTVKKLVNHICGTAKKLLNRAPDFSLVDRLKQIFKQLKKINNNMKDYIRDDPGSLSIDEDAYYDTPDIEDIRDDSVYPKDKYNNIVIRKPDVARWKKIKNKKPFKETKDSLPHIMEILQLLNPDGPKKHDAGYEDPDSSDNDYIGDKRAVGPSAEYNEIPYHTPGNTKDNKNKLFDILIDIIKDYKNDPRPYVTLKWYIKTNIHEILPHVRRNRPTMKKIRNLLASLFQDLAKNNTYDCETATYKNILKNAYDIFDFILKYNRL